MIIHSGCSKKCNDLLQQSKKDVKFEQNVDRNLVKNLTGRKVELESLVINTFIQRLEDKKVYCV